MSQNDKTENAVATPKQVSKIRFLIFSWMKLGFT